jgi:hypothetical protein
LCPDIPGSFNDGWPPNDLNPQYFPALRGDAVGMGQAQAISTMARALDETNPIGNSCLWNFAGKSTNHTCSKKTATLFNPMHHQHGLQVSARSAQTLLHTGGDIFGIIRPRKDFGDNFAAATAGGL